MDEERDLIDFGDDGNRSASSSTPSRGRGLLVPKDAWSGPSVEESKSIKLTSLGDDCRLMDAILGLNPSNRESDNRVDEIRPPDDSADNNSRLMDAILGLNSDNQNCVPDILTRLDGPEGHHLVDSFFTEEPSERVLRDDRLAEVILTLREGINFYIDGIFSESLTPPSEEAECVGDGISMDTRLAEGPVLVGGPNWEELAPSAPALEDMDEEPPPPLFIDEQHNCVTSEPLPRQPDIAVLQDILTSSSPSTCIEILPIVTSTPIRCTREVISVPNSPGRCPEVTHLEEIVLVERIDDTSITIDEIFADVDSPSLSDSGEVVTANEEPDTAPASRCVTPEASTSFADSSLAPSAPSLDTIVTLLEESVAGSSDLAIAGSSRGNVIEFTDLPDRFKARRPAWVPAIENIPPPPPRVQPPPPRPPTPPTPSEPESVPPQATEEEDINRWRCEMGPESPLGQWPHGLSSMLACLACTLGLFNISRFAILSVHFGANFIIQFILMSFVLGIPLLTYHLSLGQLLAAGSMDMWRISPLLQGIGIGLLASQALIGIYSIVGVSWMFVYFRDSFITKQDVYRWAQPLDTSLLSNFGFNNTVKLEETVSDYFSGVVLQRSNLETPANTPGHLKFQVTFNLAVVWMLVFISLSKGLKSYGKVVFLFSLVPVFGMLVLCSKLLGLTPADARMQIVFPQTDWSEFFLNTKSWCAAITESFYTWGLLGAAAKQLASHNRPKHILHRDTSFITIFTLTVLMLAAFLANTCTQILLANGYFYVPSSFERTSTYQFLHPIKKSISPSQSSTPVRWMAHVELLAGERIMKPGVNTKQVSGYQVLRLATELVPATLAVLGPEKLSPFWSVLFYFVLIMFGIAQQLAIMHCVITGIMAIKAETMKHWETTITFFTCACGFILGLPMATELGIFVVYFLDYCVGGGWWIIALYLFELTAVFMIRGRPYSGETVVATLFAKAGQYLQKWVAPILSFVWNVVLPVILMILCITVFKNGNFRDLFRWNSIPAYDFWPSWSRQVGLLIQLIPLFTIPVIGIIQSCRYLSDGPPDLFDRLQLLYRPPMGRGGNTNVEAPPPPEPAPPPPPSPPTTTEDPPPKYTPPPSYTTATGARIAKMLRQSFRRSMRRLTRTLGVEDNREPLPPPPSYATVLVEINRTDPPTEGEPGSSGTTRPSVASILRNSFRRAMRDTVIEGTAGSSTSGSRPSVASILRSSFRCAMNDNVLESSSSQRLVDSAAPINHDSFILSTTDTIKDDQPNQ